jgi:hypothetical protein
MIECRVTKWLPGLPENRIYRPKYYRYWSKNKGFIHVLTGICPEKIFDP